MGGIPVEGLGVASQAELSQGWRFGEQRLQRVGEIGAAHLGCGTDQEGRDLRDDKERSGGLEFGNQRLQMVGTTWGVGRPEDWVSSSPFVQVRPVRASSAVGYCLHYLFK